MLGASQAVLGRDQEARDSWETALGLVWRVDHDTGELHFVPETAWVLATHLLKMGVDEKATLPAIVALGPDVICTNEPGFLRSLLNDQAT